jgi:hypothetical protein
MNWIDCRKDIPSKNEKCLCRFVIGTDSMYDYYKHIVCTWNGVDFVSDTNEIFSRDFIDDWVRIID